MLVKFIKKLFGYTMIKEPVKIQLTHPDSLMHEAKAQARKYESLRLKMYKDSLGIWTIGYGFNLEANKITEEIAELLLELMMTEAIKDAKDFAGKSWESLNDVRRGVLIDMAYNVGRNTLFTFTTLRHGIKILDFEYCARRMESYLWYRQVKSRGIELVKMMRTGIKV
jgi:lysozyme